MSHLENQRSFEVSPGVAGAGPATMSSVEIAEICEKRHDHVMRDVKIMLDALDIPAPRFGGCYLGGNGRELPCYNLPRDLTMTLITLITGYSIPPRKRVIDRLDELERREHEAVALPDFSDPVAAARA